MKPIEQIAEGLQRLISETADAAASKAAHAAANEVKTELLPRLDKQDATLRLIWKQVKGNGKLPID